MKKLLMFLFIMISISFAQLSNGNYDRVDIGNGYDTYFFYISAMPDSTADIYGRWLSLDPYNLSGDSVLMISQKVSTKGVMNVTSCVDGKVSAGGYSSTATLLDSIGTYSSESQTTEYLTLTPPYGSIRIHCKGAGTNRSDTYIKVWIRLPQKVAQHGQIAF